jgi:hypothetical protein
MLGCVRVMVILPSRQVRPSNSSLTKKRIQSGILGRNACTEVNKVWGTTNDRQLYGELPAKRSGTDDACAHETVCSHHRRPCHRAVSATRSFAGAQVSGAMAGRT